MRRRTRTRTSPPPPRPTKRPASDLAPLPNSNDPSPPLTGARKEGDRPQGGRAPPDHADGLSPRHRPPCGPHPHAVRPVGDLFWSGGGGRPARAGLGALGVLPDEVLVGLVAAAAGVDEGASPPPPATAPAPGARALAALACTSRACRAFAAAPDVWRALTLQAFGGHGGIVWAGDWPRTFGASLAAARGDPPPALPPRRPPRTSPPALHSDLLYSPWACVTADFEPWLRTDTLPRVDAATLTQAEWEAGWDGPGRPCVLTGLASRWPAFKAWSRDGLIARTDGRGLPVHAGGYGMGYGAFLALADGALSAGDDGPLTVFDSRILRAARLVDEYAHPPFLGPDLFDLLSDGDCGGGGGGGGGGGEGTTRPDFRWLIVGPRGSGSTFHVDPNGTSAWNAVIRGAKKWVLYPPGGPPPPGVHPSADGADVAAPATVLEWFRNFYEPGASTTGPAHLRPVEGVARAGEVVYVPRGWWHCVLNVGEADVGAAATGRASGEEGDGDETVAITQNFVSRAGLASTLRVLSSRDPALVSGLADDGERARLGERFEAALAVAEPGALATARRALGRDPETGERVENRLAALFKEEGGGGGGGGGGLFAFNFGGG